MTAESEPCHEDHPGPLALPCVDGDPRSGGKARGGCPQRRPWSSNRNDHGGRYSDGYKTQVVDTCRSSGKCISVVSQDLGLTVSAARRWVAQADIDEVRRPKMTRTSARSWSSSERSKGVSRRVRHLEVRPLSSPKETR